jgi:hypothetical protein
MKKAALTLFLTVAALALFSGLGVATASAAGPSGPQMAIVPADAQWVIHLDMEKLVSSALFKMLTEDGRGIDIQKKAGEFSEKLKMDPFKDLKAVTVFGRGEAGEEPVVAVSGNFDKTYLIGLLKAESSYKETPYGKYTLYNWEDEHFGVFANDNLVLITEKEADIKSALDALDGKVKNAAASPLVARLQKESAGAIAVFAVADIAGLTGERKGAAASHEIPAMLAKMQSATGAISETGDRVNLKVEIGAATDQVAKDIEAAVRGVIALVNLQFTDSDAQVLTRGINVKVDGVHVRIDASYLVPELTKIIKDRKAFGHGSDNHFQPFSY